MGICYNTPRKRNNNSLNNLILSKHKMGFSLTPNKEGDIDIKKRLTSKMNPPSNNNSTYENSSLNNSPKGNDYIFKIEATLGEIEIPINVKKKEKICIKINENSTWSFYPNKPKTNYLGYNDIQYQEINVGALQLRISGSEKLYTLDKLMNTIVPEVKGRILISANLNPNDYPIYEPKGYISISIKEGINYIDENEHNISSNAKVSEKAIKILKYMNDARNNLQQFYNDYFTTNDDISDEFKNELNNCEKIKELNFSDDLNKQAQKYCEYLCENQITGRLKNENIKMSSIYGINNPLLIVKNLLIDKYSKTKENRKNILDSNFNFVGIFLKEHPAYRFCCIIVFSE